MWLKVNRLQLPLLSSSTYGLSNNSISQNSKNVNKKNDESSNDIKYSMGGLKAQTAKSGLVQRKNIKLDEKEYLRIAGSIMQTYGIKGKYNPTL